MNSNSFLLVDKNALPDIYEKVLYASALLESGEAPNTTQAAKMAGISRSVYYKYKDSVFPYTKRDSSSILTIQSVLLDKPGVLLNLLSVFYSANANILTINQSIPVKARAFVSISARVENLTMDVEELLTLLRQMKGVLKIDSIMD